MKTKRTQFLKIVSAIAVILMCFYLFPISAQSQLQYGANDPTFNSNDIGWGRGDDSLGDINALVIQEDGKILIGGSILKYNGVEKNILARIYPDGSLDSSFFSIPGFSGSAPIIALQPDGKILIAGFFSFDFSDTERKLNLARLNADGSIDFDFNIGKCNSLINSVDLQPDGKIIVSGSFSNYNGVSANNIIRLNSDGTIDASFAAPLDSEGSIFGILLQPDGKIIISGNLKISQGGALLSVVRLLPDGSLDTSFNFNSLFSISASALQPDGKILVSEGNKIIRLNPDGTLDNSFNLSSNTLYDYFIFSKVLLQADGKILMAGIFFQTDDNSTIGLLRVNADGSIDNSFQKGIGTQINSIALLDNGKILASGLFDFYNGFPHGNIVMLDSNGSIDSTFNVNSGANKPINTIMAQPDGKLLIGGLFEKFNNEKR